MEIGGWSLDQLMELAGLSVAQAGKFFLKRSIKQAFILALLIHDEELVWRIQKPSTRTNVLVVCGPGNNGK